MALPVNNSNLQTIMELVRHGIFSTNDARKFIETTLPVEDIRVDVQWTNFEAVSDIRIIEFITNELHSRGIPAYTGADRSTIYVETGKLHWDDNPELAQRRMYLWTPDVNKFPNCYCKGCSLLLNLTQEERQLQVISNLNVVNEQTRYEAAAAVRAYDERKRGDQLAALRRLAEDTSNLTTQQIRARLTPLDLVTVTEDDLALTASLNGVEIRFRKPAIASAAMHFVGSNSSSPLFTQRDYYAIEWPHIRNQSGRANFKPEEPQPLIQQENRKRQVRLED